MDGLMEFSEKLYKGMVQKVEGKVNKVREILIEI